MESTDKLAVLIDADNAQPSIVDGLLIEIANYGTASVKRIYGDWTGRYLKGWKEVLLTHSAFMSACDKFIYTEVLRAKTDESKAIAPKSSAQLKKDKKLVSLLRNAVEASSDDRGWAPLGAVGNNIAKQSSEFDSRNYGYAKLSALVSATSLYESQLRSQGTTDQKVVYVREKKKK